MKTIYKVLAFVAFMTAIAACQKSENRSNSTIGVLSGVVETRADGDVNVALQPMFLFWTEGNFNDATKTAPDFFVRTPDGEIDHYKTDKYNTGVYYPLYDKVVYSAGIAPAPGSAGLSFATSGDYTAYTIDDTPNPSAYGDDVRGVVDPLAAATISGKDSAPLGRLLFKHATTKISFEAMLTSTMTKAVTNVQVEIPGSLNPVSLVWNATSGTFEVQGGTDGTDDYWMGNYWSDNGTYLSSDRRANETKTRLVSAIASERVGYTLIAPPGNGMTVTVKYMQADNADAEYSERVIEDVPITFVDESNNAISLEAGDAYIVRFYFDNYDIELVGQKRPWEDGGFISVPIQIR